jgi:hypothetical protein
MRRDAGALAAVERNPAFRGVVVFPVGDQP